VATAPGAPDTGPFPEEEPDMSVHTSEYVETVVVEGMHCSHCVSSVTEEVQELAGVRSVDVDLASGRTTVTADRPLTRAELTAAITEAGVRVAA
jgi:copper chaperone